jgi:hypothetical protein
MTTRPTPATRAGTAFIITELGYAAVPPPTKLGPAFVAEPGIVWNLPTVISLNPVQRDIECRERVSIALHLGAIDFRLCQPQICGRECSPV